MEDYTTIKAIFFNRQERKLFMSFFVIISLLTIGFKVMENKLYFTPQEIKDFSHYFQIDSCATDNEEIKIFSFDPNTISKDSLRLLGFNEKSIQNWMKYRDKGGKFYRKDDLNKIYNINKDLLLTLHDSIFIRQTKNKTSKRVTTLKSKIDTSKIKSNASIKTSDKKKIAKTPKEKPTILIDINTADEILLQYVNGIGPTFAKRIVKFRELLGGYSSISQLLEVYGMDAERYNYIKNQVKITNNYQHLDINDSDAKTLSYHPYIKRQEANLIVAYRNQHGPYKNVYEILNIGIMDSFFVERIYPYVKPELKN